MKHNLNDDVDFFNSPIFITGLPRSGTSMVGGIISRLGSFSGKTVPGGIANPKGFYENLFIRENVVKSILRAANCDPLGVRRIPPENYFIKITTNGGITLSKFLTDHLISEGYDGSKLWMYKDAKLTLLWRIFDHYFPGAHWVIVRRKRNDFIRSCLKTSFMSQHSVDEKYWHNFADQYEVRLTSLLASARNVTEFSAERIVSGDYQDVKSFCDRTGLNYSSDVINEFVDPLVWKRPQY